MSKPIKSRETPIHSLCYENVAFTISYPSAGKDINENRDSCGKRRVNRDNKSELKNSNTETGLENTKTGVFKRITKSSIVESLRNKFQKKDNTTKCDLAATETDLEDVKFTASSEKIRTQQMSQSEKSLLPRNGCYLEADKDMLEKVDENDRNLSNKEPERETWGKKLDFMLSVIGFAVDLGNVWRFPYICYKNGGGAFLIPYAVMLVFLGMPLFYMELALGQYQRSGAISVWQRICPMFTAYLCIIFVFVYYIVVLAYLCIIFVFVYYIVVLAYLCIILYLLFVYYIVGLGYGICLVATFVGMYYNTVIAWSVYYLFASFQSEVPWAHCNNEWNTPNCISVTDGYNKSQVTNHSMLAAAEYYLFKVLEIQKSDGIDKIGSPKWELVLCLFGTFVVIYFCLWRGIKSSGKAVWVTATLPYIVLIVLLVRGCTLPGAANGILYYVKPQWHRLTDITVWLDAAAQIFFSLGPGFGTLLALSSYNKFNNNCYFDAVITSIINCLTSVLAGFVVFSILGYMSYVQGRDIDKVAVEGPGLVFVVYPEAIASLDGSVFWSIIFFLMLITLGLDSTFGGLEAVITGVLDSFGVVKNRRELFVLGLCCYCFLGSLGTTTYGGQYVINLLDRHAAPISLLFICFIEAIAGVQKFSNDIRSMLGYEPGIFWKVCWVGICPICLIALFVLSIWAYDGMALEGYTYPGWSLAVGWCITCSSLICIPIYIVYKFITTPGTFKQVDLIYSSSDHNIITSILMRLPIVTKVTYFNEKDSSQSEGYLNSNKELQHYRILDLDEEIYLKGNNARINDYRRRIIYNVDKTKSFILHVHLYFKVFVKAFKNKKRTL
ncbi:LOW QUALITY PROTEIN: hypothetical protein KUTeg_009709 [Tegillarca granosa]|uniref:Transporter n=1 Tax=Tegillarca granosa TaxID=220873 RepID=A0ABQ9F4N4_TEGGR|nr:LOW QUALITY PROTEIN: hypothetical protein KUTeg_009709 [Tegillarca granosa]